MDASVAINMLATTRGVAILQSLEGRCVIEERAAGEVTRHPRKIDHPNGPLGELVEARALEIVQMTAEDLEVFVRLAGAPSPDGLDDGEAATLAWAANHGGIVALDDAKGRRISGRDLPDLGLISSVGLFKMWADRSRISPTELSAALNEARTNGRMRILFEDMAWWEKSTKV